MAFLGGLFLGRTARSLGRLKRQCLCFFARIIDFSSQQPTPPCSPVVQHHVRYASKAFRSLSLSHSRNSTSSLFGPAPDTYWGQFEEVSKYNVHLNFLERMWAAWYAYMQNDVLATGILSFVMHEVVYFGRSLPWIIIGRIPYFQKYKIQNVSNSSSYRHVCDSDTDNRIAKSAHCPGTMEMRQACPPLPLHCRVTADMVATLLSYLSTTLMYTGCFTLCACISG